MRTKKTPLRMCTGCGEMKPKKELMRIVKNKEGEISLDFVGKKPGRGAYVCKDIECLKKSKKSKRLERVFESSVPDEVYDGLMEEFTKGGKE